VIDIKIDVSSLLDQVYIAPEQVNDMLDFTVKEITAQFAAAWEQEAAENLKSSRQEYIANLNVVDEGFAKGAVVLTGWLPNAVEDGLDEFDMKDGILNGPNVKTGKEGQKYNTIPFAHGTPGSLPENFNGGIMPKEVHAIAKKKKIGEAIKKKELPKQFQTPQVKSVKMPQSQTVTQYQHKASIYEGIVKGKDSAGNIGYTSFRRVSEVSDPSSWIHPGIEAHHFAEKALEKFNLPLQTGLAFDLWWEQNMNS